MVNTITYVAILVVCTLLIVAGSMSVHEAAKDPADDTEVNYGLRTVAWITLILSIIGLMYTPFFAHDRKGIINLVVAYVMQAATIFGLLISVVAIECSNAQPNSTTLVKPLKSMGWVVIFTGIAGLIISVTALYKQNKSKVDDAVIYSSGIISRKARELITPSPSTPQTLSVSPEA